MNPFYSPLTERYLDRVGPRTGILLLVTLLLWISALLGVLVYAVGAGLFALYLATRSAVQGDVTSMVIAAILWIFLLLSIPLFRGLLALWRERREQRLDAEPALSRLEKGLHGTVWKSDAREGPRERLAILALEAMERQALGETLSPDLTIEERILELDRRRQGS